MRCRDICDETLFRYHYLCSGCVYILQGHNGRNLSFFLIHQINSISRLIHISLPTPLFSDPKHTLQHFQHVFHISNPVPSSCLFFHCTGSEPCGPSWARLDLYFPSTQTHPNQADNMTVSPANTNAVASDTITFTFAAKTHDVVQGAFNSPCAPSRRGFYSGFLGPENTFVVKVNDTNPIWFYCSAGRHCQGGMVGGVNLPLVSIPPFVCRQLTKTMNSSSSTESLPLYIAASAGAGSSSMPASVAGGVVSPAGNSTSTSTSASTSVSSSASSTSSSTSAPSPVGSGSAGVSLRGTMGALVGAAAVLASFSLA